MEKLFVFIVTAIMWNNSSGQDAAPDVGTAPVDLIFPIESDSSSNASIVSLPSLFPFGSNFSVTSLDFLSQSAGATQPSDALYLDNHMEVFRSQESLRKYLGGVFRLRLTVVSAETGIQTAEEIRLPVVNKSYRLKLTLDNNSPIIPTNRREILFQLKNTAFVNGKNIEFAPERSRSHVQQSGKSEPDRLETCFYAVQGPGLPIPVRDILAYLQRNQSDLMNFFYEKYQVQRISYCSPDPVAVVSGLHLDGLSIGLLVFAIALSLFLIAAIIFVCCWFRMKKLHAAVQAAQAPSRLSAKTAPSQFTPAKDAPVYHAEPPLSVSQWSAMSVPTFSYGMPGVIQHKSFRRPPSSCDVQYEWQESSLDLAGDAESVNRSTNRSVNEPFTHTTSSSAESIAEDSESEHPGRKSSHDPTERCDSPQNTQL